MHKKSSLITTITTTTIGLASIMGCKSKEYFDKIKIEEYYTLTEQYKKPEQDLERLTGFIENQYVPKQKSTDPTKHIKFTYDCETSIEGKTTRATITLPPFTPENNGTTYIIECFTPPVYCTNTAYNPSEPDKLLKHEHYPDLPSELLEKFLPKITITEIPENDNPKEKPAHPTKTSIDYKRDGIVDIIIEDITPKARAEFHKPDFYTPTQIKAQENDETPHWYRRYTTRLSDSETSDLHSNHRQVIEKMLNIYDGTYDRK